MDLAISGSAGTYQPKYIPSTTNMDKVRTSVKMIHKQLKHLKGFLTVRGLVEGKEESQDHYSRATDFFTHLGAFIYGIFGDRQWNDRRLEGRTITKQVN